jgi:hypothetical protein
MVLTVKLFFALITMVLIIIHISFIIYEVNHTSNSYSKQVAKTMVIRRNGHIVIQNSNNPFRCYNNSESITLKDFYQLDCENSFLKNISLRSLNANTDVCEVFNEYHDGYDNHTLYSRIKTEFARFPRAITHEDIMNIETACPECHHIQIIDGQLFIVKRDTAANFQTRSRSMKSMLKQVTDTFKSTGDLEMFIHVRKYGI